jgi:hypothetical protein
MTRERLRTVATGVAVFTRPRATLDGRPDETVRAAAGTGGVG